MREILFRGKAINRMDGREYRTNYKNGDWVYGLVTRLYDERFELLPATMTNIDGVSGIDVDYETISEFTGLTDKQGNDIFEGDLLKADNGHIGYVVYGGLAQFGKYCECHQEFETIFPDNETIIGNIYDNPELFRMVKGA